LSVATVAVIDVAVITTLFGDMADAIAAA